MNQDEARDEIRKLVAAVTATLADEDVAKNEALVLLRPRGGTATLSDLVEQYELTMGALLQLAAGMTTLAGEVQSAYTSEQLLQKLALSFEKRWASS